jgi:hypothetical protein
MISPGASERAPGPIRVLENGLASANASPESYTNRDCISVTRRRPKGPRPLVLTASPVEKRSPVSGAAGA